MDTLMLTNFGDKFLDVEFKRELPAKYSDPTKLNKKNRVKYCVLAIQFYLKSDPLNKIKLTTTTTFTSMDLTLHELCLAKIQEYTSELLTLL